MAPTFVLLYPKTWRMRERAMGEAPKFHSVHMLRPRGPIPHHARTYFGNEKKDLK